MKDMKLVSPPPPRQAPQLQSSPFSPFPSWPPPPWRSRETTQDPAHTWWGVCVRMFVGLSPVYILLCCARLPPPFRMALHHTVLVKPGQRSRSRSRGWNRSRSRRMGWNRSRSRSMGLNRGRSRGWNRSRSTVHWMKDNFVLGQI